MYSEAEWKTVQILIRGLHLKPSDLDLHWVFFKKIDLGSAGQGLIVNDFPKDLGISFFLERYILTLLKEEIHVHLSPQFLAHFCQIEPSIINAFIILVPYSPLFIIRGCW